MFNKEKSGNNNKRINRRKRKMDLTRQNNRLKVNMRNNINSIGCNNSSFVNTSRNNNKFGIQ